MSWNQSHAIEPISSRKGAQPGRVSKCIGLSQSEIDRQWAPMRTDDEIGHVHEINGDWISVRGKDPRRGREDSQVSRRSKRGFVDRQQVNLLTREARRTLLNAPTGRQAGPVAHSKRIRIGSEVRHNGADISRKEIRPDGCLAEI